MKNRLVLAAAFGSALTLSAGAPAIAQGIRLSPAETERRVYVANEGDTLFDLASRFLGDSLMWPLLWAYNPQITNPHWIYPGDAIFLEGVGDAAERERLGLVAGEMAGAFYPVGGFYTSEELDIVGTVRFAAGSALLTLTDTVYLELNDPEAVAIGDTFAVNQVVDRIYDEEERLVAVKYVATGEIQITARHIDSDLVSGVIVRSWDPIERGDVLFATRIRLPHVRPIPATVDLEATIVDHLSPTTYMHEQQLVFINRGWSDGVEAGNRFVVWERGDEVVGFGLGRRRGARSVDDVSPLLPWTVAGEAMVIAVSEEYSTAVVVDAGRNPLHDGMRLTMQRGY